MSEDGTAARTRSPFRRLFGQFQGQLPGQFQGEHLGQLVSYFFGQFVGCLFGQFAKHFSGVS